MPIDVISSRPEPNGKLDYQPALDSIWICDSVVHLPNWLVNGYCEGLGFVVLQMRPLGNRETGARS